MSYPWWMPRSPRTDEAGGLYHALNRANLRADIFKKNADYAAFERILCEARRRLALAMAVKSRTRSEALVCLAVIPTSSLACSCQRIAHATQTRHSPAFGAARQATRRRRLGRINRPKTQSGIDHPSPRPPKSPVPKGRIKQRGLTPLIRRTPVLER